MAGGPDRRQATKVTRKADAPVQPEHEPDEATRVSLPLAGLALPVRPSLRVGAVNDPAELEAESVAELVVDVLRRTPEPGTDPVPGTSVSGTLAPGTSVSGTLAPGTQSEPAGTGPLRRAPVVGAAGGEVDESASAAVEQLRGGGQPLPGGIRRSMESAFGADLSGVRVHTGPTAARLNDQLGAHAFTAGDDIVFAEGLPDVRQPDGQRLMAHELTHVLQHRGADTLSALRRQAATVARPAARHAAPESAESESSEPERVQLDTVSFARPAQHADPDSDEATVRRLFDVAVKPNAAVDGSYYIESIVIKNRPKKPTGGMEQEGGKSFHHESAWALIEKRVTQFAGKGLGWTVDYLTTYGLDGWPPMGKPGADAMAQMMALNTYFNTFLVKQAELAAGWLGSTAGHSKQGGTVSKALEALQKNWSEQTLHKVLSSTFEPSPSLVPVLKHWAAEAHGDNVYSAFQLLLEDESGASQFSMQQHEQVLGWIKDWTTGYWDPSVDESTMDESGL